MPPPATSPTAGALFSQRRGTGYKHDPLYNSLDPYSGPLGTGWTHSYDIAVKENSDGSVVLREGDGGRKLYTKTGSGYLSQPGDYSALAKNADNTFVITQADGSKYTFGADGKIHFHRRS